MTWPRFQKYLPNVTLFMCSNIYLRLHPLINNILKPSLSPPTSVAGDESYRVAFKLFDHNKQRGFAGHQQWHVTGRHRQLWGNESERQPQSMWAEKCSKIQDAQWIGRTKEFFLHPALKIIASRTFLKKAESHYSVFMLFGNWLTSSADLQLISGPARTGTSQLKPLQSVTIVRPWGEKAICGKVKKLWPTP